MIVRDLTRQLIEKIDYGKIIILKGARQTGKTTVLKEIQHFLDKKSKESFYIAADTDFENKIFKSPEHFLVYLNARKDWTDELYLLIDEFQYINNAGQFLKILYDKHKDFKFIVSGSSSLEITKNSEFLTGRKISLLLRRISFYEFLNFKNKKLLNQLMNSEISEWKINYDVNQTTFESLFAEYSSFGAYPEILTTRNKKKKVDLLNELILTYLQKDVAGFLKVGNTGAFNRLVKILVQESGRLLSKSSLSSVVGISQNTLNHYLDILEGTYVFEFIPPFFTNIRKETSKMKKILVQDFGFSVALNDKIISVYDDFDGWDAETSAGLAIRNALPENKLFHYRTISKSEIDFVLKVNDKFVPIEVKFRNKIKYPIAFENFIRKYESLKPVVITKHFFENDDKVIFIPLPLVECYFRKKFAGKTD